MRKGPLEQSSLKSSVGNRVAQMCVVGWDSHDTVGRELNIVGISHHREAGDM